jgi:hypothetical protein
MNTAAATAAPPIMPSTDGVQQQRGPSSSWPLSSLHQGVSKKYESPPQQPQSTTASTRRTIIMAGNERQQRHPRITMDHRDDNEYYDSNNNDPATNSMMILSRLDIEIQGIGRPRNQSKVQQSLEDDYREMMRRLTAFIYTAKKYHQSLLKTQLAKEKVTGLIYGKLGFCCLLLLLVVSQ